MSVGLAQLRAAPHDRERLQVYADYQQAQGHPRGELIAISLLAEDTTDPSEYLWARSRAHELAAKSPSVHPPAPLDDQGQPCALWTNWSRGFIRRIELLIEREQPRHPDFPDWPSLIEHLLEHPSLTLLEQLVVRVDTSLPANEQGAFALRTLLAALGPIHAHTREHARPPLQLDLWTSTLPEIGQRARLAEELRAFRPYWFSWDLTMIPPPRRHPAAQLLANLADLRRAGDRPANFDMLWFDAGAQFIARLDARSGVIGGVQYDAQWNMHLRRLAELDTPLGDPLVQRCIDRSFDPLAARFQHRAALAPPPPLPLRELPPELSPYDSSRELLARLSSHGVDARQLANALLEFPAPMQWRWLEIPCREHTWRGFVGYALHQVLAFGLL